VSSIARPRPSYAVADRVEAGCSDDQVSRAGVITPGYKKSFSAYSLL
jgi:hypothetical protein